MPHRRLGRRIEQIMMNRLTRYRLEGEGTNELHGTGGHHHPHLRPGLAQAPNQIRALVGGNAAGHPQ
jgi:hypothetical protein